MNHLGRALTEYDDPPVKVLFVYNCNPAATVPDQRRMLRGLEREDLFTVVLRAGDDRHGALRRRRPASTRRSSKATTSRKAYGPIHHRTRPPGDRRGRRSAIERRRLRRAVRAASACSRRTNRTGELDLMLHVLDQLPGRDRRRSARRRRADRRRSASRRFSSSTCFRRPPDRKVDLFPDELERKRADGAVSLPTGSGDRRAIRWR